MKGNRWYFPGSLHHVVFEFLKTHCQHPDSFVAFAEAYQRKHNDKQINLNLMRGGYVNKTQLMQFLHEASGGGGVSVGNVLARIYDSLVYWDVFSEIPLSGNLIFDFQINFLVVQNYQQRGILENIVKGPALIPARYNAAIAAIVIEKDKQESIGSGSVVSHNGKVFVLTNRHVVDPSEQIKICKVLLADKDYPPPSPSNLVISNNDDLAAFPISVPEDGPKFSLGDAAYVLQEVILLGFPKIPLTKRPHLTAHSGEINATIVTRNDEELYLISNYASPGSSGGPLIDYRGLIIGVVSDSLEAEYEEAIFQHSAAVTLPRVRMFLESKVLSAFS